MTDKPGAETGLPRTIAAGGYSWAGFFEVTGNTSNSRITEIKSIVIATGDNYDLCFFNLVDQSMFPVNPSRPATGKLETKGFWFSRTLERGSPNFFKKCQNPFGLAFICLEPITQVVERSRCESDVHNPRASMGVRLPDRASLSDCSSREALVGLESRYSLSIIDS